MIRSFVKSDTDNVMSIWLEGTIDAHDFIDEHYWKNAFELVKNEYLLKSDTYVYIKDYTIVGFIGIISGDTLGSIFIKKEHRHLGIGTQLLDHVKSKYDQLSVSVYQKNLNAIAFYKKNQFKYSYTQTDLNTNEKEDVYLYSK